MRLLLGVLLGVCLLLIVYKTAQKSKVPSFTAKFISEYFQNNSSGTPLSVFQRVQSLFQTPYKSSTIVIKPENLTIKSVETSANGTVIIEKLKQSLLDVCSCEDGNCSCCLVIDIPDFSHSVCVNATYNPRTIGLVLSIRVDDHYFSQEISLKNPPPVCFSVPVPGLEPTICVAFTKMDVDPKAEILSGCLDLEIELLHLRLIEIDLGCFHMPI
ncbi:hypothetical protein L5515_001720 [Caenorhabditis briggsae]|uniref:DUF4773 domain-containing protein n=1 Tax=Caenorhabditis briggsae TaxID=6238 RepID=A0AAE9J463_CAEBR|nr:hypothetical protein L5515_001720 [Caenorhabditis briggsae]